MVHTIDTLLGKVAIKAFAGRDANRKLDMLHRICHERFVSPLEIFEFHKTCYAVFEHVGASFLSGTGYHIEV